jgi:hypothetical protein
MQSTGNDLLKAASTKKVTRLLRQALDKYTEGLKYLFDGGSSNVQLRVALLSNSAQAHMLLENWRNALKCAVAAITFDPQHFKSYLRGADSAFRLKEWQKLEFLCEEGLKLEPEDKELMQLQQVSPDSLTWPNENCAHLRQAGFTAWLRSVAGHKQCMEVLCSAIRIACTCAARNCPQCIVPLNGCSHSGCMHRVCQPRHRATRQPAGSPCRRTLEHACACVWSARCDRLGDRPACDRLGDRPLAPHAAACMLHTLSTLMHVTAACCMCKPHACM